MENRARDLSRDDCVKAVTLANEGLSYRTIAGRLGVSHSTVSRVVRRFRETNDHKRRPGQGRPRVTTAVHDRFIRLRALRERFTTSRAIQMQLRAIHNVQPCVETVARRLRSSNLKVRIPARGPALTPEHRRARLQFAREHIGWNIENWQRVCFSDESRFSLYSSDRRVRVIRRPHERYAQCNIQPTHMFNGGSIMVWGGISFHEKTNLVPLREGSLNSRRYIDEILSEHVVPLAAPIGQNFIFMHDNARPHTARIVNQYLQEQNVTCMNWPARSPDLNPIEHLWDVVGRQLRDRQPPPASLDDVEQMVIEIWNEIDQDQIRSLISSMNRRCQAVIESRGGNTRY